MPGRFKLPQRRKQTISQTEWDTIQAEAKAARELLYAPRYAFIRDYFITAKDEVVDFFVQNHIKPVTLHEKASDSLIRVLHITRKEQEEEVSGKYQLANDFLPMLQDKIDLAAEMLAAQERGDVTIDLEGGK